MSFKDNEEEVAKELFNTMVKISDNMLTMSARLAGAEEKLNAYAGALQQLDAKVYNLMVKEVGEEAAKELGAKGPETKEQSTSSAYPLLDSINLVKGDKRDG